MAGPIGTCAPCTSGQPGRISSRRYFSRGRNRSPIPNQWQLRDYLNGRLDRRPVTFMGLLEVWYLYIILIGITVGRYFGRWVSLIVMLEMFQVGIVALSFANTGRVNPVGLIPGVGVLPRIGRYSGVSPGGLIPPLVFILVSIFIKRRQNQH
jgi:hypothetical protein